MNAFVDLYAGPPGVMAHAAALLIVGPLIAACAAALAPSRQWAWIISVGGSIFAFWMALCVTGDVAREGVVSYALGGFAPPLGIELRIDALGAMFVLLISGLAVAVALFSGHSLAAEVNPDEHALYQAGFLLCQSGLLGLCATGDAFNAFVFLEISSIGTYALIAIGGARDRRALPAAFNYLIMGTIGATLFVTGVGFLYGATGTLNMADMAARLATLEDNRAAQAGVVLVLVGLGLKAAMFPLHGWLPGAYAHAPTMISAFLAGTGTKAALYLMMRFVFSVTGDWEAVSQILLHWVLAPLAAAAALVCSAQAIFQSELRRMLAFSSVAQVGYIILGFAVGTTAGVAAALLHVLAHALMKTSLFMAVGGVTRGEVGGATLRTKLSDFAGAGRDAPGAMVVFGIGALSLMGAPLTAGFLSKWRLVEALMQAGWIWAVVVIAVASLLSLIYVGRMLEVLFFREPAAGAARIKEAPVGVLAPLWVLGIATLWFGIDAALPEGLANAAALAATSAMTGGAP